MLEPLGAATARAELDVPATLHAPLFRSCIENIDENRRIVVLDLGAAQTRTIALFGGYRCRMEIVDIADSVEALNAERETAALESLVERVLPKPAEPLDLVLCWDLLNYFARPALSAVMAGIAKRTRRGALAHGLIVYLESRMPARPGCYVPLEDYRLVNLNRAARGDRAAPRYSPEDLKRCMPDFSIERGRLLANGMQEFLFRR